MTGFAFLTTDTKSLLRVAARYVRAPSSGREVGSRGVRGRGVGGRGVGGRRMEVRGLEGSGRSGGWRSGGWRSGGRRSELSIHDALGSSGKESNEFVD